MRMQSYESLNDAAPCGAGSWAEFEPGATKVWYTKIGALFYDDDITNKHRIPSSLKELEETHCLIGNITEKDPENVFGLMQREFWSPNGEAARMMRYKGVDHISMRCGDIVQIDDRLYMCTPQGWVESSMGEGDLQKPSCPALRKPYYDVTDGMSGILEVAETLRDDDEEFHEKVLRINRAIECLKVHMDETYIWD